MFAPRRAPLPRKGVGCARGGARRRAGHAEGRIDRGYRDIISGRRGGLWGAIARAGLAGLAVPYRLGVAMREALYRGGLFRSHRLDARVVSVGNLVAGGTGKTPMVEFVCRRLANRGARVAILMRGYGARGPDGRPDEAAVLATRLPGIPILLGKDRVASGTEAIRRFGANVLVLDDGFQHRRLARDLDIVLVDAQNPFGYGHLLPRGLLREPLSALRRAGLLCVSHADHVSEERLRAVHDALRRISGGVPALEARFEPVALHRIAGERYPPLWARGKKVLAVAGIGNPDAFPPTIERLGATVVGRVTFPDHHDYGASDVAAVARAAAETAADIVATTAKDAVKLVRWPETASWVVVEVTMELPDPAPLDRALDALLSGEIPHPHPLSRREGGANEEEDP